MSRWFEHYNAHPFRNVWENLKVAADSASVDDKTVITSVNELARLKKAITYIDELLKGIDPELVPPSTWDNFNSQVTPCFNHVVQYNSNRNIAHIQNANSHIDNLLTYVRPYMVAHGKAAKAIESSLKEYAATINGYMDSFKVRAGSLIEEINKNKDTSAQILELAQSTNNTILELEASLFGDGDNDGLEKEIKDAHGDIVEKHNNVVDLYNETFVGIDGHDSTKKAIQQAKDSIISEQTKIEELLEGVDKNLKELGQFHTKIFGKPDEEGKRIGGLSGDLDRRIEALTAFEGVQNKRYRALNDQIESLLPGATSAGLATAYKEMKDSFNKPIKNASNVFYVSIAALVMASIMLAIDSVGGEKWITFVKFETWDVVLKGIVYKIPFYAPVLWLAFYASKRRSEYQRLQQEYAHKEALAKSYDSYKQQIQQLDDKDLAMQKEFIMKAIDAIAYNASATLDGKHGDKTPVQDLADKIIDGIQKVVPERRG